MGAFVAFELHRRLTVIIDLIDLIFFDLALTIVQVNQLAAHVSVREHCKQRALWPFRLVD